MTTSLSKRYLDFVYTPHALSFLVRDHGVISLVNSEDFRGKLRSGALSATTSDFLGFELTTQCTKSCHRVRVSVDSLGISQCQGYAGTPQVPRRYPAGTPQVPRRYPAGTMIGVRG